MLLKGFSMRFWGETELGLATEKDVVIMFDGLIPSMASDSVTL